MALEFFMRMKPPTVTAQERKVTVKDGRPFFYEPPELRKARTKLTDALAGHAPADMMEGPLELVVKWCFLPKDVLPGELGREWHRWRTERPDTDNLDKLLKDCMTRAGFWKDDAQVCREIIEKYWAGVPGIYIRISELD